MLHDDLIDVLATTRHPMRPWHPWHLWHRPVTSPAVWTRLWGASRLRDTRTIASGPRAGETIPVEVHGTPVSLAAPDPNTFGGGVRLLDLVRTPAGEPARANGDLALHARELMTGLPRSATEGRTIPLTTTVDCRR